MVIPGALLTQQQAYPKLVGFGVQADGDGLVPAPLPTYSM